ncbi:hypothetical protein DIPPA_07295 [Diplonema papillatum]|nr:hypothetical protein DIPPA_07295 [Diplonema papillatum]
MPSPLSGAIEALGPNREQLHACPGRVFLDAARADVRKPMHLMLPREQGVGYEFEVAFCEVYIDLNAHTDGIIDVMQRYVDLRGFRAMRDLVTYEIYGSKQLPFWMSPAHNGPTLRIGRSFWFTQDDDARAFFVDFWEFLHDNGVRFAFHWGKHGSVGKYDSTTYKYNQMHLSRFPKIDRFKAPMAQYDSQGSLHRIGSIISSQHPQLDPIIQ